MRINRTSSSSKTGAAQSQKAIGSLSKGDTFAATVTGISGGEVTLTLSGGGQITARSQNYDSLTKGERLNFVVEANEDGRVFVKITKDMSGRNLIKIAEKALADAELPINENNLILAKTLIEKGISFDSEKLRKASHGMTFRDMSIEKLVFLIEENIEINETSLKQLNDNISNSNGILTGINALIEKMAGMPEAIRNEAFYILFGKHFALPGDKNSDKNSEKSYIEKEFKRAFFMDIAGAGNAMPEKLYKKLYGALLRLRDGISENDDTKRFLNTVSEMKQALDFQNDVSENKLYLQLPFVIGEKDAQADLYVFNDKKASRDSKKHSTALLCLDLANIGHVESFIVKSDKSVACSFRLTEPRMIKIFRENSFTLHKLLAEKGFKLVNVSFEQADGVFNLLMERPGERQDTANNNKKYSFDMKA